MSESTKRSDTHKEKYFHITPTILNDIFEDTAHFPFAGATVFYRHEPNKFNMWYADIALCAHGDQFNRKVGRNIARRRYFSSGFPFCHRMQDPTFDDALTLFEDVCSNY